MEQVTTARRIDLALLRIALLADSLTFLTAATLNFGARIPLGFATLAFPAPGPQAGTGEAVIGTALLVAGVTLSRAWSWVAFWLSVMGIAFGLAFTSAAGGPAFEVHLILAPLALLVLGLLVWTHGEGDPERVDAVAVRVDAAHARSMPSRIVGWLMLLAALTLLAASAIHFGITVPLGPVTISDPFPGAMIPEGILGLALLAGSVFVLARWPGAWGAGLGTALFTLLLTIFGLTVTVSGGRGGDIAYHVTLLVMLAAILGLLLSPAARHELPR